MRRIPLQALQGWLLAGLWMLAAAAPAADLAVSPVRVTLGDNQDIAALNLTNNGDEQVVMQASINDWSIRDNQDHYESNDELVVTPPVFSVEPGKTQIVRIGLSNTTPNETEQAFRIFLEQAPATPDDKEQKQVPKNKRQGVQVMLRLGIPVFVAPQGPRKQALAWKARRLADNRLRVTAMNQGNVHVKVRKLALIDDGDICARNKNSRYILPDSQRQWVLDVPASATPPYDLKAWTQDGKLQPRIAADSQ